MNRLLLCVLACFASVGCATTMSTDGTELPEYDEAQRMTADERRAYMKGGENMARRIIISQRDRSGHKWKSYLNRKETEKFLREMGIEFPE